MRRAFRIVGGLLGVAALAAVAFAGYMMYRMGPRDFFGMLRYDQREEGDLRVGDAAPDVTVRGLDGRPTRLRERFGGRPVVLVFGSYT